MADKKWKQWLSDALDKRRSPVYRALHTDQPAETRVRQALGYLSIRAVERQLDELDDASDSASDAEDESQALGLLQRHLAKHVSTLPMQSLVRLAQTVLFTDAADVYTGVRWLNRLQKADWATTPPHRRIERQDEWLTTRIDEAHQSLPLFLRLVVGDVESSSYTGIRRWHAAIRRETKPGPGRTRRVPSATAWSLFETFLGGPEDLDDAIEERGCARPRSDASLLLKVLVPKFLRPDAGVPLDLLPDVLGDLRALVEVLFDAVGSRVGFIAQVKRHLGFHYDVADVRVRDALTDFRISDADILAKARASEDVKVHNARHPILLDLDHLLTVIQDNLQAADWRRRLIAVLANTGLRVNEAKFFSDLEVLDARARPLSEVRARAVRKLSLSETTPLTRQDLDLLFPRTPDFEAGYRAAKRDLAEAPRSTLARLACNLSQLDESSDDLADSDDDEDDDDEDGDILLTAAEQRVHHDVNQVLADAAILGEEPRWANVPLDGVRRRRSERLRQQGAARQSVDEDDRVPLRRRQPARAAKEDAARQSVDAADREPPPLRRRLPARAARRKDSARQPVDQEDRVPPPPRQPARAARQDAWQEYIPHSGLNGPKDDEDDDDDDDEDDDDESSADDDSGDDGSDVNQAETEHPGGFPAQVQVGDMILVKTPATELRWSLGHVRTAARNTITVQWWNRRRGAGVRGPYYPSWTNPVTDAELLTARLTARDRTRGWTAETRSDHIPKQDVIRVVALENRHLRDDDVRAANRAVVPRRLSVVRRAAAPGDRLPPASASPLPRPRRRQSRRIRQRRRQGSEGNADKDSSSADSDDGGGGGGDDDSRAQRPRDEAGPDVDTVTQQADGTYRAWSDAAYLDMARQRDGFQLSKLRMLTNQVINRNYIRLGPVSKSRGQVRILHRPVLLPDSAEATVRAVHFVRGSLFAHIEAHPNWTTIATLRSAFGVDLNQIIRSADFFLGPHTYVPAVGNIRHRLTTRFLRSAYVAASYEIFKPQMAFSAWIQGVLGHDPKDGMSSSLSYQNVKISKPLRRVALPVLERLGNVERAVRLLRRDTDVDAIQSLTRENERQRRALMELVDEAVDAGERILVVSTSGVTMPLNPVLGSGGAGGDGVRAPSGGGRGRGARRGRERRRRGRAPRSEWAFVQTGRRGDARRRVVAVQRHRRRRGDLVAQIRAKVEELQGLGVVPSYSTLKALGFCSDGIRRFKQQGPVEDGGD